MRIRIIDSTVDQIISCYQDDTVGACDIVEQVGVGSWCICHIDDKIYRIKNGSKIFDTAVVQEVYQHPESDSYWAVCKDESGLVFEVEFDEMGFEYDD